MEINRKYQVFVSSTYSDLIEERQEVIHALLELDCIPSGMELFPAADEDQWSLIKSVIDECDYYLLILGGRYGSIGPDGVGYTEKEYRYALEVGKPIIGFLIKNPTDLPAKNTETTEDGQRKYRAFREYVEQKHCKYWTTAQELGSVASRGLINLQRKHPGIGWIKADQLKENGDPEEILRLRKEIDKLNDIIRKTKVSGPEGSEKLEQGDDKYNIEYTADSVGPDDRNWSWTQSVDVSWDQIFYEISPLLIDEASDFEILKAINSMVSEIEPPKLERSKEGKGHKFKNFHIASSDYNTIKVQLRALGLIEKSDRNRSVKDAKTYWTLTPYGDSVMNSLRAIKKEEFDV
jgi:hypothetical protein